MSILKLAVKYKKEIAEKDIRIDKLLDIIEKYEQELCNESRHSFVVSVQVQYEEYL